MFKEAHAEAEYINNPLCAFWSRLCLLFDLALGRGLIDPCSDIFGNCGNLIVAGALGRNGKLDLARHLDHLLFGRPAILQSESVESD